MKLRAFRTFFTFCRPPFFAHRSTFGHATCDPTPLFDSQSSCDLSFCLTVPNLQIFELQRQIVIKSPKKPLLRRHRSIQRESCTQDTRTTTAAMRSPATTHGLRIRCNRFPVNLLPPLNLAPQRSQAPATPPPNLSVSYAHGRRY